MNVRGISAFVTGGASGLGAATVRMLVERGANVAIYDLPTSKGSELEKEIGPAARFVAGDVTDEAQTEAALDDAIDTFGPLRAVVNCAGIGSASRTVGKDGAPFPLAVFRRSIEVNLIGTFNVIRLGAARMSANEPNEGGERGAIVNTASIAAFDGQIGQAAYSASKGGIVGLTLPVARDLARHGIRVCTIAPGLFRTPLLMGLPEPALEALGKTIPFPPRLGDPAEYAALALQILENPMLNGEVIRLDGALRMAPR
jgi:NAD(P)-dependent dehydrogenase (short-subunit alcohol dehydrogenase family)